MHEFQHLRVVKVDDVVVVHPEEHAILGRALIYELVDELLKLVDEEKPRKLLLTFDHVNRCSSEAIAGLIRVRKRVVANGGEMKLCVSDDIRDLFRITKVEGTLFDIHTSESAALEAFLQS